ncbi:hypothetical protein [Roseovarius sp. M141]|uniref:hypothetical protein n=1 Tax=Roseovarius sp. M141 TaxID=2583806 RepID=UPI0020CC897B|nr:hypothetical protein [Roseovarius sp. M141]MCQ0091206.1 hypothetical protein [Roseovarius sp. M141]
MNISIRKSLLIAVCSGLALQACSRENVADNTFDGTVFVVKTIGKTAVGAGKLAVKGGTAAVNAARESRAAKTEFPRGTAVCENASGGYYAALTSEQGELVCLPK